MLARVSPVTLGLLGLLVGFAVGFVSTTSAGQKPAKASKQYEYAAVRVVDAGSGLNKVTNRKLNSAAADGWKLVTVDAGVAYFKRKK